MTLPGGARGQHRAAASCTGSASAGRAATASRSARGDRRRARSRFASGAALVVRREAWDARRRLRPALLHVRRGPRPVAAAAARGLGRRARARGARSSTTTSSPRATTSGSYLERNRWWTLLGAYPAPLLALLLPGAAGGSSSRSLAVAARGGWLRGEAARAGRRAARAAGWALRGAAARPGGRAVERRRVRRARSAASLDSPYLGAAARVRPLAAAQAAYWRLVRSALRRELQRRRSTCCSSSPARRGGRETYARELVAGARARERPDLRADGVRQPRDGGRGARRSGATAADRVVVLPRSSGVARGSLGARASCGGCRAPARAGVDVLHSPANFGAAARRPVRARAHRARRAVPAAARAGADRACGSAPNVLVAGGARGARPRDHGLGGRRAPTSRASSAARRARSRSCPTASTPAARRRRRAPADVGQGAAPGSRCRVATDLPHKNLAGADRRRSPRSAPERRPLLAFAGHGTDAGALRARAVERGVADDVRLLGAVDGRAGGPLRRRGAPRHRDPLRGLRAAGARGDGARRAGRLLGPAGAARGRRRRGRLARPGDPATIGRAITTALGDARAPAQRGPGAGGRLLVGGGGTRDARGLRARRRRALSERRLHLGVAVLVAALSWPLASDLQPALGVDGDWQIALAARRPPGPRLRPRRALHLRSARLPALPADRRRRPRAGGVRVHDRDPHRRLRRAAVGPAPVAAFAAARRARDAAGAPPSSTTGRRS